ncbi:response regulator transcription factor [Gracilimonas sp.]|uniref:response regulator transcription factor n=1 Tax=Gracilimonas sp. TaxID=1974203 RepID=UPI0037524D2C
MKRLTPREVEVLDLTGVGHTCKEIGEQLFISKRTVHKHRENIRKKLGLSGFNSVMKWYQKKP